MTTRGDRHNHLSSGPHAQMDPTTATAVIPRIPQDIIDDILSHLAASKDSKSLTACALVSKSWVQSCRRHLFRYISIAAWSEDGWIKTFPVPEDSPVRHARDLEIRIGDDSSAPGKFFEYLPWFTNLDSMTLSGHWGSPLLRGPSYWRLPQSITSLAINTNAVTLVNIRDIMVQLPNLDDLSLSVGGSLAPVEGNVLPGIGMVLKGRFSGRLVLCGGYVDKHAINMLLEIPSGLRFTEMHISCSPSRLHLAARLVEACGKTLVKLSRVDAHHGKSHPFSLSGLFLYESSTLTPFPDPDRPETSERSFNLSNFPNLQEVNFDYRAFWTDESLSWIPAALSTLTPATSPRLSVITLDLSCSPVGDHPAETLIANAGVDLRRVADEVARIEREFKGAVNITVVRDPVLQVVLDTLNVRFSFAVLTRPRDRVDSF